MHFGACRRPGRGVHSYRSADGPAFRDRAGAVRCLHSAQCIRTVTVPGAPHGKALNFGTDFGLAKRQDFVVGTTPGATPPTPTPPGTAATSGPAANTTLLRDCNTIVRDTTIPRQEGGRPRIPWDMERETVICIGMYPMHR